jgi:hypothetical protein
VLGVLLIWLCFEAFNEETTHVSPTGDWGVRQFVDYSKNKVMKKQIFAGNEKKSYSAV